MKVPFVIAILAVPAFIYFANANNNNNHKDFMKEDDLKQNEFADFDVFDEDDDFETEPKIEADDSESGTLSQGPGFTIDDIIVEVSISNTIRLIL